MNIKVYNYIQNTIKILKICIIFKTNFKQI